MAFAGNNHTEGKAWFEKEHKQTINIMIQSWKISKQNKPTEDHVR